MLTATDHKPDKLDKLLFNIYICCFIAKFV